jgi:hypothetical protein
MQVFYAQLVDILVAMMLAPLYAKLYLVLHFFCVGFTLKQITRAKWKYTITTHKSCASFTFEIVDPLLDITLTVVYAKLYTSIHLFCISFTLKRVRVEASCINGSPGLPHTHTHIYIHKLGECPCVAMEHKLFVKILAHDDCSKKNNT